MVGEEQEKGKEEGAESMRQTRSVAGKIQKQKYGSEVEHGESGSNWGEKEAQRSAEYDAKEE